MVYEDEILIDEEVKEAIDGHVLDWDGVETGATLGGAGYHVNDQPFAILLEGVVVLNLPDTLRKRALTLAGVSPFRPPDDDESYERWIQFVIILAVDVPAVIPWLEAAHRYVLSLPDSDSNDGG